MRRKVSRIGPSTLMVSLPMKWVKKNNIKKGDELELVESGNNLNIIIDKKPEQKSATFDVSELDNMLYRFVGALYKAGFDDVKLIYKNHEQLKTIYKVLNNVCIGYEIIEEGNKYVVVKQIAEVKPEDFDKVLRRLFQFLISISGEGTRALQKNDKALAKEIMLRDYNVNKAADFCRRCLNKNPSEAHLVGPLYHIIEQLERIGDIYKNIFRDLSNNNIKTSKSIIKYYSELTEFLNFFYSIFYKSDNEKLEKFHTMKENLDNLSKEINDPFVIQLDNIKNHIYDLNGSLMLIQASKLG